VSSISFHVSEIGKPVLVKTSYFPNWQATGAKGPYRAAPNLMVVVPTSHDVTLTYGLSKADWVGRFVTLISVAALGALITWKGIRRYRADRSDDDPLDDDDDDAEADVAPDAVPEPATTPGSGGLPPPGVD
jgi:hypothetical protein